MDREGEHKRTVVNVSKELDDIKTGIDYPSRDKLNSNLLTGWAVSGIETARARSRRSCGTAGTRIRDAKGRSQVTKSEAASTNVRSEGGSTGSSVDVAVMVAERSGRVVPVDARVNSIGG